MLCLDDPTKPMPGPRNLWAHALISMADRETYDVV